MVDEEIDLVRYVIKYGEEKAHKVFQFTLDRLHQGEYTPEEKFTIGRAQKNCYLIDHLAIDYWPGIELKIHFQHPIGLKIITD